MTIFIVMHEVLKVYERSCFWQQLLCLDTMCAVLIIAVTMAIHNKYFMSSKIKAEDESFQNVRSTICTYHVKALQNFHFQIESKKKTRGEKKLFSLHPQWINIYYSLVFPFERSNYIQTTNIESFTVFYSISLRIIDRWVLICVIMFQIVRSRQA